MSRIGKNPVIIPDGVTVAVEGQTLTVSGPKGSARLDVHPVVTIEVDEAARQVVLQPAQPDHELKAKELRAVRAQWGTAQRLLTNIMVGVTAGYKKELQVVGVGYGAEIKGNELVVSCGFANTVSIPIPDGVQVSPPQQESVMVSGVGAVPGMSFAIEGTDKQTVGQFAAAVRSIRAPEPYKGKGIRYRGEEVKHKAGKALAAGSAG